LAYEKKMSLETNQRLTDGKDKELNEVREEKRVNHESGKARMQNNKKLSADRVASVAWCVVA
jgi:hypothetical protein